MISTLNCIIIKKMLCKIPCQRIVSVLMQLSVSCHLLCAEECRENVMQSFRTHVTLYEAKLLNLWLLFRKNKAYKYSLSYNEETEQRCLLIMENGNKMWLTDE